MSRTVCAKGIFYSFPMPTLLAVIKTLLEFDNWAIKMRKNTWKTMPMDRYFGCCADFN